MTKAENFEQFNAKKRVETERVGLAPDDIVEALHKDAEFFINFYLGDDLEFAVPQFHKDGWNLITQEMILYIALALPRGHAKTTLSKLCCVWYLLFTPTRFVVYVSNTANIAVEACQDIIKYLENSNHSSIFGHLRFSIRREGHGYYKFYMNCPDGKGGFYEKFVILKALGAGQQVRGLNIDNQRPELAIVDDLEDNDNTATPMLQKKLKIWFFGAFIKAMSKKRHKIIYLGNMLSNQSILYYIVDKSQQWHSMRYGALLSDGRPLWPEMWSLEAIQADYLEYQQNGMSAIWYAEMMNMPMAEGQALIDPSDIPYLPEVLPGEQRNAFITYDPAISQKTWANDSALAVHAWVRERWQITEVVAGKYDLEQIYHIIVELCHKWNTRCVGIEKGAFQIGISLIFDILMKSYNQSFNIYEVEHKNRSKVERLAAWCGLLKAKTWVLTEGDQAITQQLIGFDPLKTNNIDDIIDACAMGPTMTGYYMSDIMDQYTINDASYKITNVIGD